MEPDWLTHFSRACQKLGIEVIKAYSPQAKGCVERSHAVYQDRFCKELKLKKMTTIAEANALLSGGFINQRSLASHMTFNGINMRSLLYNDRRPGFLG